MAISAYVGLPGSGKSYGVVENVIIPALKEGQTVFTNIPMKDDHCFEKYGYTVIPFDMKDIIDNPNWWTEVFEAGAVLVIDELWRLWASGITSNKARMQDKEFLAEHRHLVNQDTGKSTNIAFVTQDLAQISNFAKLLVDKTFKSTKLDAVGSNKRFRVDIYQGGVSGTNIPQKHLINQQFCKYKKDVYDSYVSHTKSDIVGDETRTDNRFNFLKSTTFKVIIAMFFVPAFVAYKGLSEVNEVYYSEPEEVEVVSGENVYPGNEIAATTGPVAVAIPKKPKFKFLSEQDSVYISFNMGVFPDLIYQITVENEGVFNSVFTADQLAILDYSLTPISTCAVRVTGPDFDGVVLCRSAKKQRNAIERAVSTTSD